MEEPKDPFFARFQQQLLLPPFARIEQGLTASKQPGGVFGRAEVEILSVRRDQQQWNNPGCQRGLPHRCLKKWRPP